MVITSAKRRQATLALLLAVLATSALTIAPSTIARADEPVQIDDTGVLPPDPGPTDEELSAVDSAVNLNSYPGEGGGSPATIDWLEVRRLRVYYQGRVQTKVINRHGLAQNVTRYSTVNPSQVYRDLKTPLTWIYRRPLTGVNNSGAPVTNTVVVRTIVSFKKGGPRNLPYGVVSSYCEGYQGLCPAWINLLKK